MFPFFSCRFQIEKCLASVMLGCKVKWALGSITANKPGGGDSISVELFQILKDDAVKFYAQYASKFGKLSSGIMLKILQAGLQQYLSCELPDVQAGFRKGRGTRDQIANIHWLIEKAREFQKNIYFCFIDYVKAFDCVDCNKLWKIPKEMGIPDHLTCLLRNLYAVQEATVIFFF